MRLSTLLPLATADPAAAAAHVTELERAGLGLVWVAEPYGFDAPTMLGYLAAVTSTVQLAAYREAGVTVFNVEPAGPGPLASATVARLKSLL
jgi:alkanesulfonate monooxygenase SsuD/methylene tetrahydromethanopterin reductase-like flavin-dependent oxidoreductase (luciferase family)